MLPEIIELWWDSSITYCLKSCGKCVLVSSTISANLLAALVGSNRDWQSWKQAVGNFKVSLPIRTCFIVTCTRLDANDCSFAKSSSVRLYIKPKVLKIPISEIEIEKRGQNSKRGTAETWLYSLWQLATAKLIALVAENKDIFSPSRLIRGIRFI